MPAADARDALASLPTRRPALLPGDAENVAAQCLERRTQPVTRAAPASMQNPATSDASKEQTVNEQQCRARRIGHRGALQGAAALLLFAACAIGAASPPIEVLKEMPQAGTVRQGEVVYVDDGRCPVGEIKKITGGNQKTGVARQVVCVKRPRADARP